jgi:hypothetical protein
LQVLRLAAAGNGVARTRRDAAPVPEAMPDCSTFRCAAEGAHVLGLRPVSSGA